MGDAPRSDGTSSRCGSRPRRGATAQAARLLEAAVAFAREHGAGAIELEVTDGNEAARRLYERYGFVETGRSEPLRDSSPLAVRALRLERG